MNDLKEAVYSGKRYEAMVPDTLDLAERADLAINGIGGTIDPDLHYHMFFFVRYAHKTPYMAHHAADPTCDPKFAESFPMLRIMSGSNRYADIEAGQRAELISRISPEDGLYWNIIDPTRPWRTSYNPAFDGVPQDEDVANVVGNARMLRALLAWRELDGDPACDKLIRGLVRGLRRIAINRDDYSFYPDGGFGEPFNYPRSGWLKTDEPKSEVEGGEGSVVAYHGHQIQALARWIAISDDPEALDLAARLTCFCMLPKFWGGLPDPDGNTEGLVGHVAAALPQPACVAGNEQGHWYSHFHCRAIALRGMLEYGRLVGDVRVLEFVRRAYEYTWTFAIPRMGWINCYPARVNVCEGCALGDIVALGIRLTDAGLGDYWDDVDAVVRNHLVEQQLVRADLLERVANASPARGPENYSPYANQEARENVIERSLGNFAGQSSPTSIPHPRAVQCCTGNGTQGLYYAWECIVRQEGNSAQVNLLLNRAAQCLDVDSYLPYEGRVTIHNRSVRRVSVRIPSWIMRKEIRADVSGVPRPIARVGNYLVFDDLKPSDKINIEFPIRETTGRYTACAGIPKIEQTYTCTFRGSTLVDISPRDDNPTSYPLYLREHMRKDKAPLKKITRFASGKTILRW